MNRLRIGGVLFTEVSLFRAIGTFTLLGLLILITSCSTKRWTYESDGESYFTARSTYEPFTFHSRTISVTCYPSDVLEDVIISIDDSHVAGREYIFTGDIGDVYGRISGGFVINPWSDDSVGRERAYQAYSGIGTRKIIDEQSNVFNLLGYRIDDEPVQIISLPIEAYSVDPGEPENIDVQEGYVSYPTYRFQLNNMEGTNFLKSLMGKGSELYIRWYPDDAYDFSPDGFSLSRSSATIRKVLDRCGVNIEDL